MRHAIARISAITVMGQALLIAAPLMIGTSTFADEPAVSATTAEDPATTAPAAKRPKFSPVLRQNEDWSVMPALDESDTDFFDPIKHIPLSDDGEIWVSFGGQARLRLESWNNFGFTDRNDDEFLLTRLRVHSDLHVGPNIRVFAEGKSAFSTDRDLPGMQRTLDNDELDLQQLFADLSLPLNEDTTISVRGGRQMFVFGRQRLVSPLDWSNSMRTWDGVRMDVTMPNWEIAGFWTQFVPVQKYDFNTSDQDEQFWGIYATGHCPDYSANIDLYYLGRDRDMLGETRHTIGGRLFGQCAAVALDYDIEGAAQVGERGGQDIEAWMLAVELARKMTELPGEPRMWIGFDVASGDDDPATGKVKTFDQLYPLGHAYLGFIDVVGRQNIIDLHTGLQINPLEKLTAKLSGHVFWREDEDDALYNAGGGVVRAGTLSDKTFVGSEIDLLLIYKLDRHVTISGGYSHFFAGDFIDNSGSHDDIDFVYTTLQITF